MVSYEEILNLAWTQQLTIVNMWAERLADHPESRLARYHYERQNKKLDEIHSMIIARERREKR